MAARLAEARQDAAGSDDDEDIFSVQMRGEREAQAEEAMRELVGGDTAVFKPLRLDEDEEGDEGEEPPEGEE